MTTVARIDHRNAAPTGALEDVLELAENLIKEGALPDRFKNDKTGEVKRAQVIVALLAGRELDLQPIEALNSFYIVNGQLSMAADTMIKLAQNAGHRVWHEFKGEGHEVEATTIVVRAEDWDRYVSLEERLMEETDDKKIVAIQRVMTRMEHRITWGFKEVKKALLASDIADANHNKYPRAMRRHRADSECIRMACSGVLGAYKYTPEEISNGLKVNEQGIPTGQVTVERMDRPTSKPERPLLKVLDMTKETERAAAVRAERDGVVEAEVVESSTDDDIPSDLLDGLEPQGFYDLAANAASKERVIYLFKEAKKRRLTNKSVRVPGAGKRTLHEAMELLAKSHS